MNARASSSNTLSMKYRFLLSAHLLPLCFITCCVQKPRGSVTGAAPRRQSSALNRGWRRAGTEAEINVPSLSSESQISVIRLAKLTDDYRVTSERGERWGTSRTPPPHKYFRLTWHICVCGTQTFASAGVFARQLFKPSGRTWSLWWMFGLTFPALRVEIKV